MFYLQSCLWNTEGTWSVCWVKAWMVWPAGGTAEGGQDWVPLLMTFHLYILAEESRYWDQCNSFVALDTLTSYSVCPLIFSCFRARTVWGWSEAHITTTTTPTEKAWKWRSLWSHSLWGRKEVDTILTTSIAECLYLSKSSFPDIKCSLHYLSLISPGNWSEFYQLILIYNKTVITTTKNIQKHLHITLLNYE